MKGAVVFAIALLVAGNKLIQEVASSSPVDCNFDSKQSFCSWKREWFGMRRAGWKSGRKLVNFNIEDRTGLEDGKFSYFLSRSRPTGFRSRIRSVALVPSSHSCFVFWVAMGGVESQFPDGNSLLRLYLVKENGQVETAVPLWNNGMKTPRNGQYTKVVVSLHDAVDTLTINHTPVQFVFEVIRGNSKKSYVAVDDISLTQCENNLRSERLPESNAEIESAKKIEDVKNQMIRLMLPAQRPDASVKQFPFSEKSTTNAFSLGQVSTKPASKAKLSKKEKRRRRKEKRRRNRRRRRKQKGKTQKKKRRKIVPSKAKEQSFGTVFLEESSNSRRYGISSISSSSQSTMCDFIEYTQRLQRCLRNFFSMLHQRPHTCNARYTELETCVRLAATSCIPLRDMPIERVEEIVLGTLRDNFKTKQVFCEEEGAFVYPEFSVEKVPIQCSSRYFIKLGACSGTFSNMFQLRHGNPRLCREYYAANECQREATAEECNFDTETMLLYGLNLQYQFAHNPFCVHLPFSAWWPDS